MKPKLTKQGVRDLGNNTRRNNNKDVSLSKNFNCDHRRMRTHCKNKNDKDCGHIVCPDCGLFYDLAADG